MYIFACCSLFGTIILMPVNYSGDNGAAVCSTNSTDAAASCVDSKLTGLMAISLSNVPSQV